MKALFLDRQHEIEIRDVSPPPPVGPHDVRIGIHTVGICGSDVHYYTHGRIGPYVVKKPMILGHEAAGTILEIGSAVTHLAVGDRVCMEPGVPNPNSKATKLGIYNVDPDVTFWATPPVDGCLTNEVVHPAAFTFRLPDNVSFAEGAMVEPFAIGMQSATKAKIKPGDTVAVIGSGTIGLMTALAALAGGAARAIVSDLSAEKLAIAARYPGVIPCNIREQPFVEKVMEVTSGWGADVVFECSGSPKVFADVMAAAAPGGAVVLVGIPIDPIPFDIAAAQAKELRFETVFRYANMYDRSIDLIASGKVDLKPLITSTYVFDDSVEAFERAAEGRPTDVKLQITFGDS
ncbi:NAD(P)-dependent alcohol dehydrogenase [Xanthomonas campestris]|uniref:NAD(P)-dependent alcohol dehydrogenase n=1 Tax=Xanthomonas campestris TaxID=339 RepID=UPI001E390512|nr:NAD(P)-dependent alcohol dehydrogenase [Xanthomonas campestris]MCC5071193.1 NAD(P)-dependent alcohol dehydrogenase [Xanthomonas campestris pv. plantaginis]